MGARSRAPWSAGATAGCRTRPPRGRRRSPTRPSRTPPGLPVASNGSIRADSTRHSASLRWSGSASTSSSMVRAVVAGQETSSPGAEPRSRPRAPSPPPPARPRRSPRPGRYSPPRRPHYARGQDRVADDQHPARRRSRAGQDHRARDRGARPPRLGPIRRRWRPRRGRRSMPARRSSPGPRQRTGAVEAVRRPRSAPGPRGCPSSPGGSARACRCPSSSRQAGVTVQPIAHQARKHLALDRDHAARGDEIEHPPLDHVRARRDLVGVDLAGIGLLEELGDLAALFVRTRP